MTNLTDSTLSFHKISWQELADDCLNLFPKLKEEKIDRILSISRGGTVISRIFSDLLGTLPISHITISSYHDLKKLDKPVLIESPDVSFKNQILLIIDEVSDTGETFHLAKKYALSHNPKQIFTLSPYIKPHTTFHPDFWLKEINKWIIFPYDLRETYEGLIVQLGTPEKAYEQMKRLNFTQAELEFIKNNEP